MTRVSGERSVQVVASAFLPTTAPKGILLRVMCSELYLHCLHAGVARGLNHLGLLLATSEEEHECLARVVSHGPAAAIPLDERGVHVP